MLRLNYTPFRGASLSHKPRRHSLLPPPFAYPPPRWHSDRHAKNYAFAACTRGFRQFRSFPRFSDFCFFSERAFSPPPSLSLSLSLERSHRRIYTFSEDSLGVRAVLFFDEIRLQSVDVRVEDVTRFLFPYPVVKSNRSMQLRDAGVITRARRDSRALSRYDLKITRIVRAASSAEGIHACTEDDKGSTMSDNLKASLTISISLYGNYDGD